MKQIAHSLDKTVEADFSVEQSYDAWKRAKIERGLAESCDRDAMIPAEQI